MRDLSGKILSLLRRQHSKLHSRAHAYMSAAATIANNLAALPSPSSATVASDATRGEGEENKQEEDAVRTASLISCRLCGALLCTLSDRCSRCMYWLLFCFDQSSLAAQLRLPEHVGLFTSRCTVESARHLMYCCTLPAYTTRAYFSFTGLSAIRAV